MNDTRQQSSIIPMQAGAVTRDSGGTELELRGDVSQAIEAREVAAVKARCALARSTPRDWDTVRVKLLRECERKGFAETAIYQLPRGGKTIEGLTVRFAETCGRLLGNLWVNAQVVHETPTHRVVEVSAMDLETNFTESQQGIIARTVERRADRDGKAPKNAGRVLNERLNSYGEKVFICECTDEEMLVKMNALVSRIRRNKILEMVPADIRDEAKSRVQRTLLDAAAKDPDAERKKLSDAFASLGVLPADLKAFISAKWSTDIARLRPEHLVELRGVHAAVKDGVQTWDSFLSTVSGDVDRTTGEVVTRPPVENNAAPPRHTPPPPPLSPPTPTAHDPEPEPALPLPPAQQVVDAQPSKPAAPSTSDIAAYAAHVEAELRAATTMTELKKAAAMLPQVSRDYQHDLSLLYIKLRSAVKP